jgi:hypothetical protein
MDRVQRQKWIIRNVRKETKPKISQSIVLKKKFRYGLGSFRADTIVNQPEEKQTGIDEDQNTEKKEMKEDKRKKGNG